MGEAMNLRREFVAVVLEQMHVPYKWGGKLPALGLDCSGLVTHALWKAGGPDWRQTYNTDKLWNELVEPQMLRPGDICLYGGTGPADVSHVMVWLMDPGGAAGGIIVGACGGDSTTTSQTIALRQGARVKVHRSHLYRKDFRGFRSLPLGD